MVAVQVALTPKQARALQALTRCRTREDAARAAGVSPRTLRRWMAQDDFKDAVHDVVRESLSDAVLRLKSSAAVAVDALASIAADAESEHARVQAAGRLLDANMRLLQDAARGIPNGPVPTFVYDPDERDTGPQIYIGVEPRRYEPTIQPEVYAEVERLLMSEEGERQDEQETE